MISVYVIKGENLPIADIKTSDPYVRLFGRTEFASYEFGKTSFIKNNLNPIWDEECKIPFCIEIIRANCLYFEVYDFDALSNDDLLGYTYLDFNDYEFGSIIKLSLTPSFTSSIFVKVIFEKIEIPLRKWDSSSNSFYAYLTANPPIKKGFNVSAAVLSLPSDGKQFLTPIHAIYYDEKDKTPFFYMGEFDMPDGSITNVIRINPALISNNDNFVLGAHKIKGYKGTITFHIMQCGKEKNNGMTADGKTIITTHKTESSDVLQLSLIIENSEPCITNSVIAFNSKNGIDIIDKEIPQFKTTNTDKENIFL